MTRLHLGLALLLLLLLAAVAAPWAQAWLGTDPFAPDLFARYAGPSPDHPLGADELGRDLLLRLLYGAQVSLGVGLAAALAASVLGTALGLLAAWRGGWVDAVLMRLADGLLALPALPILVLLAAMDPAKLGLPRGEAATDMLRIVAILVIFGWVGVARLARAGALSLLATDYIRAARALGVTEARLLWRHVLPGLAAPVAVACALAVAGAILTESVLSFLGLGIQPPSPSWGNMLANAQEAVFEAPLAALWPGLAILLAVAGCALVADGVARRGR
ncbi:ABC transporter permease [Teichococcus vastitatis]|jgi:peptide/nickel transport system permease protein|uniref:ABC transporter permease n=1 Tax=Teichococcus vastitatis TaxID=2307076 RepID=A0ABS9W033_9PROT|nr:ABC transporter permease [Pseudoroseomonas vastitatis]MCI0752652.1 ABC transporter permease [Pseudoroseomonas vastitatis]